LGADRAPQLKTVVGRIRRIAKGCEMKVGTISLLTILVLAMAPLGVSAKNVPLRYTRRLPRVDKVELQRVQSAEIGIGSIESVKIVEGKQADAIALLWRTQSFRSRSPECHQPGTR
jgi:hypothetical protein